MPPDGVILYGPPACGKDTVTAELTRLDSAYVYFRKMKTGTGRADGYRMASPAEVDRLAQGGQILYENHRYGNRYVVDRPALDAVLAAGRVPVIHMGQVAGVRALRRHGGSWLSVLLWCARDVAAERARNRSLADLDMRLAAWDETAADIDENGTDDFTLRIDTALTAPGSAAEAIHLARSRGSRR